MAAADNRYSRFVAWSKIVLPLAALALLSTLFLFARGTTSTVTVPYAEIEEIAREAGISRPALAGIADDGTVVAVTARTIRPDPGQTDSFFITDVGITLDATDGSQIAITAADGHVDGPAQIARISGPARAVSSSGYTIETQDLTASLRDGTVATTAPVTATAPFGTLTAGGLRVHAGTDGTGTEMVFNNRVRLLYQPQP
jgi:lipopolysaccharide export system protein LptC